MMIGFFLLRPFETDSSLKIFQVSWMVKLLDLTYILKFFEFLMDFEKILVRNLFDCQELGLRRVHWH